MIKAKEVLTILEGKKTCHKCGSTKFGGTEVRLVDKNPFHFRKCKQCGTLNWHPLSPSKIKER